MRYDYVPIKMAKIKTAATPNAGEDVSNFDLLIRCWYWDYKAPLQKQAVSHKIERMQLPEELKLYSWTFITEKLMFTPKKSLCECSQQLYSE